MTKFYTIYLWVATISIALGQFRTDIPTSSRPGIEEDFTTESEDKSFFDDLRFKHQQSLSSSFMLSRGIPTSINSYTNTFTYHFREDLILDANVHLFNVMGAYSDLWGQDTHSPLNVNMAFDAGFRYYPANNGIFNVDARTHHSPFFNGQYVDLNILGFTVKRLYKSENYHPVFGPDVLD